MSLYQTVREALANAHENGYSTLLAEDAEVIAGDLAANYQSLENCDLKDIEQAVVEYKTKKRPRLLYREEAINDSPWVLPPDEIEAVIDINNLVHGETVEVEFKRVDITDEAIDNAPMLIKEPP